MLGECEDQRNHESDVSKLVGDQEDLILGSQSTKSNGCDSLSLCAGDPFGSGSLQNSSAEGVARHVPLSVFSGSTLLMHDNLSAHSEIIDYPLSNFILDEDSVDSPCIEVDTPPCLQTSVDLSFEVSSDMATSSGDVIFQDGGRNTGTRPATVTLSPREYFFDIDPLFCSTQFIDKVGVTPIYHNILLLVRVC